jgi:hypothetical protein
MPVAMIAMVMFFLPRTPLTPSISFMFVALD